jgi:TolB-like protein/tetratricopeptide (TPR) repeat protein
MAESSRAVFLSYASEDTEAAARICNSLQAAGIEVWFDRSELRGGDVWDQSIRKHIKTCALFLAIISRNTHQRTEGYFRLEWKLAVDRSYLITAHKAFLVPVAIDETTEQEEHIPERFREVQWTRLRGGETSADFVERIKRLLCPEPPPFNAISGAAPGPRAPVHAIWRKGPIVAIIAVVVVAALAYPVSVRLLARRHLGASPGDTTAQALAQPAALAFAPPPHSIAVLPFVNMSGDKEQEYFSEGLTEELLNSLSRISELQVAARTSSFSFEGDHADIATIAHRLNVASVLEGSVRRSAHTIRITAQLIDSASGFHLWSQTYDRSLGDVLALQTEIATSVAKTLKITLLEDTTRKIEVGGTENPAAFDAYLRGKMKARTSLTEKDTQATIAAFTQAIDLDPRFAMAFAERSIELSNYAQWYGSYSSLQGIFDRSLADAGKAVSLAPDLAEGHYATAVVQKVGLLQFAMAHEEFERAFALAPGSARILSAYSRNAAEEGHTAAAIAAARRAVVLDPLNFNVYRTVGISYFYLRRYADAIAAYRKAISLQSDYVRDYALLGEAQYALGDFEASRSSCETAPADEIGMECLALVYWKLGRKADAEAIVQKVRASEGDEGALGYTVIYAQRGDLSQALDWLELAARRRDPGLLGLKADPYFDPLRKEPRFQAIVQRLNFPD